MPAARSPVPPALPDLHCACANLRRAARLVTQLYSEEMGPGLEPAQFALLSALSVNPGAGQAPLARALGLDKTTLSRNLRLLERNRWIAPASSPAPDRDGRERAYRITRSGQRTLAAARPGWLRAQSRLRAALKPDAWETSLTAIAQLAAAANRARQ